MLYSKIWMTVKNMLCRDHLLTHEKVRFISTPSNDIVAYIGFKSSVSSKLLSRIAIC